MAERVARGFVVAAEQSTKKTYSQGGRAWARFDLAQADVAQGEDAERLEQGSGNVLQAEGERGFVGSAMVCRSRFPRPVVPLLMRKKR